MTAARRLSPEDTGGSGAAWGWCGVCQRWFYPRHRAPEATCPVCATPAEKTAERPEQ